MILFFESLLLLFYVGYCAGSTGDASPYYQKCLERCNLINCTDDGLSFKSESNQLPLVLQTLRWSCNDECCYECMWLTINAFQKRNWQVPQFYGKWPFYRLLGLQEPASVLFSLLNLYMHIKMIKKFRSIIQSDYPLYGLWHFFAIVCMNAWVWSAVFHARDTPQTEILDYSSAFSIIMVSCFCMIVRIFYKAPRYVLIITSTFLLTIFLNHVAYISLGKINYAYNMQLNITIGGLTAVGWFFWCMWNRHRLPYVWKCAAYISLTGLTTLLEVVDRPSIYFIVDFHALWHLSSALLIWIFYDFIIDDCKYLKKLENTLKAKIDNKQA